MYTDNTGVVAILNKNFSGNALLRAKLLQLYDILSKYNASIVATHIEGEKNVIADEISRTNIGDSWKLCP